MATVETESEDFVVSWTIDADLPWTMSLKDQRYGRRTLAMFANESELLTWASGHEDRRRLEPLVFAAMTRRTAWLAKMRGEGVKIVDAFTFGDEDRTCLVHIETADNTRTTWRDLYSVSASRLDALVSDSSAREILRDYAVRNPEIGGWLRLRSEDSCGDDLFVSKPFFFYRTGEWPSQILSDFASKTPGAECCNETLIIGDAQLYVHVRYDEHRMFQPGCDVMVRRGDTEAAMVSLETTDELRAYVARWITENTP